MTAVARVQALSVPGEGRTWTVLGSDHRCVGPIEEFLEYHRVTGSSLHTVRAYAKGLQLWWEYLSAAGEGWEDPSVQTLGRFVTWLRTGLAPNVTELRPMEDDERSPTSSTVETRLAAVVSFYRFHHDVHGYGAALARASVGSGRRPYRSFLAHLDKRRRLVSSPLRLRRARPGPPPMLSPKQVALIHDACAERDASTGIWSGSLRDRLLFATLAETGMRLGEALCLTHAAWHMGHGATPLVEVTPCADHPHGAQVKGGRPRRIYISDDLERLYGDYLWMLAEMAAEAGLALTDDWFCFVNLTREPRFSPLRPESVYQVVARLRRQLGGNVPAGWTPHWFRHTHATALLLAGVPLHVVSRRLGHADVQTTMNLYGWVTEDAELRAAAEWRRFAESWRTSSE
jgi:site-specific recombinase XerD